MKKYLLDTNICIYLLKSLYQLDKKIDQAGIHNCFISEITIAELKFGAENSKQPANNHSKINALQEFVTIIPIFTSLDVYAKE